MTNPSKTLIWFWVVSLLNIIRNSIEVLSYCFKEPKPLAFAFNIYTLSFWLKGIRCSQNSTSLMCRDIYQLTSINFCLLDREII